MFNTDIKVPGRRCIILRYVQTLQFFCIAPYKMVSIKSTSYALNPISLIIISIIVIFYWIGFYYAWLQSKINTDIMSRIINHFQMTLSGIALTTILITNVKNIEIFNEIVSNFNTIDDQLHDLGGRRKAYKNEDFKFLITILVSVKFIFIHQIVNILIQEQHPYQPRWYFIVSNTPITFYSVALVGAILMINFLNTRCHILLDIVQQFNRKIMADDYTRNMKILKFLNTLNVLMQLNNLISRYFGAALLTTFATIFTIATVQSYYIYCAIADFGQFKGFDAFSLIQCVISNMACFMLLIGITSVCEILTNTMKAITNKLSKTISQRKKNAEVCYFVFFVN